MKAERRHQLQNNELAKQLETLPEKLQRHASKIVLAVTFFALCLFIFRYRQNAAVARQNSLAGATAMAQLGPRQLRSFDAQFIPPEQLANYRTQITSEVNGAIDTILREAEGDEGAPLRAEALLAKGDLNWTLANLTPLPGAATQPALKLKPPEEYLKVAESAYRDVLAAYAGQIVPWVAAQFGLAAIAENRHDWSAAQAAYAAVINNNAVPLGFQQQARAKLLMMNEIQGPMLLGQYPATAPSSQPTTGPSASPNSVSSDFSSSGKLDTALPTTGPTTAP
ncbi:hypothetical protein BH09PLA1_BH09PLA1_29710 [soil metagenome]